MQNAEQGLDPFFHSAFITLHSAFASMKVTIPLYVEEHRPKGGAGGTAATHVVRPLFFDAPVERGEQLNRVVAKLAGAVRKVLDALGERARHDELARWTFCPDLDD